MDCGCSSTTQRWGLVQVSLYSPCLDLQYTLGRLALPSEVQLLTAQVVSDRGLLEYFYDLHPSLLVGKDDFDVLIPPDGFTSTLPLGT